MLGWHAWRLPVLAPRAARFMSDAALAGSVKKYDRHLLLCTNTTDWPYDIGMMSPFVDRLTRALSNDPALKQSVKLTACHRADGPLEAPTDGSHEFLLFPDRVRIRSVKNIGALIAYLKQDPAGTHSARFSRFFDTFFAHFCSFPAFLCIFNRPRYLH